MTTMSTQSKWALIGVRICAVYLVVWIVPVWTAFLNGTTDKRQSLTLPTLWSLFAALRLWRLSDRGRLFAGFTFFAQIAMPIAFLLARDIASTAWLAIILMWLIAFFWIVFLSRPAAKALFENQKSEINNQKS